MEIGPPGMDDLVNQRIEEVNATEPGVDADRSRAVIAVAIDAAKRGAGDLPPLLADIDRAALAFPAGHTASLGRASSGRQGVKSQETEPLAQRMGQNQNTSHTHG